MCACSLTEHGTPLKLFGSGETVVMGKGSWAVDVDIIFKGPQDASWQE